MNLLKSGVAASALIISLAGGALAKDKFNLGGAFSPEDAALTRLAPAPRTAPPVARSLPNSAPSFALTLPAEIVDISADPTPVSRDPLVTETEFDRGAFSGDPKYKEGYDAEAQIQVYGGKTAIDRVAPLAEIGRDLYGPGEIGEGIALFGEKNRLTPQLVVFGDQRTAVAYNKQNNGQEIGQLAARLNLFFNLQLTGTERVLMLWEPFQDGAAFTRYEFAGPDRDRGAQPEFEFNDQPTTLFFEGDMSAILAGLTDEYKSYDLPFSFGRMPLLFQNGVWLEDAFLGGAFTIPAKNSAALGITNYDITFFAGGSEITSDAFVDRNGAKDDDGAIMIGAAGFFDVAEGYLELGYAYLHDTDKQTGGDQSYHNVTAAFTKRYFGAVSNSTRIIANFGQSPGAGFNKTANGFLLLSENAFITHLPLTLIPYTNFWIGKDNPQSVARAGAAGGVLRNTGLAFETDNLTGFPTLDPTGRDTFGGAVGLQYLFGLDQQLVVEAAAVVPWDGKNGAAGDNQYALSARYQIPLTNQIILRADAIYGFLESADDVFGARLELRVKF